MIYEYARPFFNQDNDLIVGHCSDCNEELTDLQWGREPHGCPMVVINNDPHFLSHLVD